MEATQFDDRNRGEMFFFNFVDAPRVHSTLWFMTKRQSDERVDNPTLMNLRVSMNSGIQPASVSSNAISFIPAPWIYLALAVVTEVAGLIVMKISLTSGRVEGLVLLYAMVALSYVFLAKAVKSISVGVAYAIWEGSGIALITLVSSLVFQRELTGREWLGLAMVVAGNFLIRAGEVQKVQFTECSTSKG